MKKIFKILFINILILLIIFLLIELFLHFTKENHLRFDRILGWSLKENLNITKTETDFYGEKYNVNFKTQKNGIITYGKNNINEILVIGDSFSTDPYVSTDKMWYSIFAEKLKKIKDIDIKVNVIGAGGYGTFQQYLLLKRLKSNFKPKLIIIQFCTNDFENNYLKSEKLTGSINQYSRRPYFQNAKIEYSQDNVSKLLRFKLIGQSRIINKILFIFSKNRRKLNISDNDYLYSRNVTINILKKIKEIYPNKNYLIFNCNIDNINLNLLSKKTKMIPVNSIYEALLKAQEKNEKIYYRDGGHYNEYGHRIIGNSLFEYFIQKNLINHLK